MATRPLSGSWIAKGVHKTTWDTLTTTNADGAPQSAHRFADKSIQVTGTFGAGGTLLIQGSNDGGATWATLADPNGNALSITAAKIETILENVQLIRPFVSAGDGTTDLDVTMVSN